MGIRKYRSALFWALAFLLIAHCYSLRGSKGGGQTEFTPPRKINPADILVPPGYAVDVVAESLTFPTSVVFDDQGELYITEAGYSYGEVWEKPRLLHIDRRGNRNIIAHSDSNGPWTGAVFVDGHFYVAEGGQRSGGAILRISKQGEIDTLVSGLPSMGDHHTNPPALGPDGWLYFGQGTATNSGVVGIDNADFGWLFRYPEFHDTPCRDITLAGENFTSPNPLTADSSDSVVTGAYSPFGKASTIGQVVEGRIPCNGAIFRIRPRGGDLELVAWGFRNPYGVAFSPLGELYMTENGYDDRGSRPVWGTGDVLWKVQPGKWYGWPDFSAGDSITNKTYAPPGKKSPKPVLSQYPENPPSPVAVLGVHSSSNGFDFSQSEDFGFRGDAFVAQFGDMSPGVGKVLNPVGFKVVRVDVKTGVMYDFAANKGGSNGPASKLGLFGLERPISAKFDPGGASLYVVDFGVMTMDKQGPKPFKKTGVIWRITKKR